jgi:hypothetical protein
MLRYPHLLKQHTEQPLSNPYANQFWRTTVFERLCVGEAPFGTSLVSDTLVFKKQEIVLIQSNAQDVMDFFQQVVGLQLEFVQFATWKEIKRKIIKDNLIQDFVTRSQEQFDLDAQEAHRLLSTVHLYQTIKRILPHEIRLQVYPHMYIEQIDGISFRGGKFVYTSLADRESMLSESSQSDDDDDDELLDSIEDEPFTTEEPDEDENIE